MKQIPFNSYIEHIEHLLKATMMGFPNDADINRK